MLKSAQWRELQRWMTKQRHRLERLSNVQIADEAPRLRGNVIPSTSDVAELRKALGWRDAAELSTRGW